MKRYGKWIGALLLIALVGCLVLGIARRLWMGRAEDETPTRVTVTLGDVETTVEASGRVVPLAEAALSFDMSGLIAEVLVEEGQSVPAGDPLIQLDSAALKRTVRSAEQNLAIQEANLAELRRGALPEDIAAAEVAVASAQAQLAQLLAGPRQEELALAEAHLKAAQASVWAVASQRDQVTVGASAAEIAAAQAQVATALTQQKIAQDTYDRVTACRTVTLPTGEQQEICPGLGTPEEQARYNLHAADEALAAAQAQLDRLLAGATEEQVNAANANVAGASAQREAAQAQLNLLLAGSTDAQIAAARAQLAQAQSALAALVNGPSDERLDIAEAQVEQARIGLEEARDRLARATLVAPFEGIVTRLLVKGGEWTMAGNPVMTLADLSAVELELAVDEVDIGSVAVGQPALVTLETWPDKELPATVTRIAPMASTQTGVVTYRVYLTLDADNSEMGFTTLATESVDALVIRPGMTANAEIITRHLAGVLLVPNRAIRADRARGRYTVERVTGGDEGTPQTETVEVTIGIRGAAQTQVLSGLQAGDEVLIRPLKIQPTQELTLPGARRLFGGQ